MPTPTQPNRICANCGRANISPSGRKSATGRYFCMAQDCRNAKAREDRALRATGSPDLADAPTVCFNCQRPLVPRKVRVGDSPTGYRWCSREGCRNHRAQYEHEWRLGIGVPDPEQRMKEQLIKEFAVATMTPASNVTCPECQLTSAVEGFIHPVLVDGTVQPCLGVGEKGAPIDLAKARWPEFFGGDQ